MPNNKPCQYPPSEGVCSEFGHCANDCDGYGNATPAQPAAPTPDAIGRAIAALLAEIKPIPEDEWYVGADDFDSGVKHACNYLTDHRADFEPVKLRFKYRCMDQYQPGDDKRRFDVMGITNEPTGVTGSCGWCINFAASLGMECEFEGE